MRNTIRRGIVFVVAVMGITLFNGSDPCAAYIVVYGGPEFDSVTGTGYGHGLHREIGVNDSGTAVGSAYKYFSGIPEGQRAVRWDGSGATATEMGNLGTDAYGYTSSEAVAVNDSGTAVGWASTYVSGVFQGYRAVRWEGPGTSAIELGHLGTDVWGYSSSHANAVNDGGTAVGVAGKYVSGVDKGLRAVRWDGSGTSATELDNLGTDANGITGIEAVAVNDSSTAVGWADNYVSGVYQGYRAVRWDGSGTSATELGHLGTNANGSTLSRASAVNNGGTAVGYAKKYISGVDKGFRAVRWDGSGTTATELGNLGTDANGYTNNYASAVTDSGMAVGSALKYVSGVGKGFRAVRWNGSGTIATELGELGTDGDGLTYSYASAVNDSGTAVGVALKYVSGIDYGHRAVAWGNDGVAIDLNTLMDPASGWTLNEAHCISDSGWIAGIGQFDPDGLGGRESYNRLFMLQLVPEPSSLQFAALAIVGLAVRQLRRAASGC